MLYWQGVKKTILTRPVPPAAPLIGLDPVLARVFQSRGIAAAEELDTGLQRLPSPWLFSGMRAMADCLAEAVFQGKKLCVVADFDADGATSCALAVKGLSMLGARRPSFITPNRFKLGYGLTPEIVALILRQPEPPDILLTVDNGVSSIEGAAAAKAAGLKLLITDHHLPGAELPRADAMVNPNLSGDAFPGKHIAGVGVMFYVLMALRIRLRELGWFEKLKKTEPNLAQLLDYVALGTVADVVALDQTNRILVHQGLRRIRAGQCQPGIKQLCEIADRALPRLNAADLGFALAPRLNAAGRMDDMTLGIQCLLADNEEQARHLARQLDQLNQERKEVEGQMKNDALALLHDLSLRADQSAMAGVCLYDPGWHQGVIGILASRIKDRLQRPVIAFAPADNGDLKGSARSIAGVHIRDALSDIAAAHPKILSKFGGHALAAGLTIKLHDYPQFALLFAEEIACKLTDMEMTHTIYTDGELDHAHFNLDFAEQLQQAAVWGQAFPEPAFRGAFDVIQCRVVGGQHLKFVLRLPFDGALVDAIAFFAEQPESWLQCRKITAVYKLDVNWFRGQKTLQLQLHYLEKWE